jgi:hypothetical protein
MNTPGNAFAALSVNSVSRSRTPVCCVVLIDHECFRVRAGLMRSWWQLHHAFHRERTRVVERSSRLVGEGRKKAHNSAAADF